MGSLMEMALDIVRASMDPTVGPKSPPQERGWVQTGDDISNFDHEIPDGLEDKLRSGEFYCDYAAWNFHATAWFEGGKFHAYVLLYRRHVGTYEADSLKELMTVCSDAHGSE